MELDFLLGIVEKGGYPGLFLWILLGSSTLPVPNEFIMMTIGLAASQSPFKAIPIFFTTLAGVLAALSASYLLGRLIGRPLLEFLAKKERFSAKIASSLKLMDKYHGFSLSLSYFLPGARSFVPFLYGFSRLSFKKFILFAYTGATAWLLIMFMAGYLFGEHINIAAAYAEEFTVAGIIAIAVIIGLVKSFRRKPRDTKEEPLAATTLSAIQKGSPD